MATNVTEKDKTLNDVIEWCGEQVSGIEKKIPTASDADFLNGERCALLAVAAYCGIGVCTGMHPECVHCTVRQLEQAQAEGPATPDVSPSDAYRRTHAKGRRLDGKIDFLPRLERRGIPYLAIGFSCFTDGSDRRDTCSCVPPSCRLRRL